MLDGMRTVAMYSSSGMPSGSLLGYFSFSSNVLTRACFALSIINVAVLPWSSACLQAASEALHVAFVTYSS